MRQQAAVAHDLHQEGGNRLRLERLSARDISDRSRLEVDGQVVAWPDAARLRTHERWQAEVDSVAIEKAGERRRDQCGDAEVLERFGCLLSRGARAEVAPGDDNVAFAHSRGESGIEGFHAMARDFADVEL